MIHGARLTSCRLAAPPQGSGIANTSSCGENRAVGPLFVIDYHHRPDEVTSWEFVLSSYVRCWR